ncbi:folylpolyglutamate synthase, mitochondrial-like [Dreissena polymorpha]|uniref:Folylpolyglutamate synthase n=1 Tax=Dreissena polymorpha TaxID=45954 RepID=A0A9D4QNI2_DREPO|nr:folylpolyglutamate synthase, mitochondrial-like [Dreissena polymorpha]KAH3836657.1 hypothetical protein DPMN_110028 [Dreissena polymorpha]
MRQGLRDVYSSKHKPTMADNQSDYEAAVTIINATNALDGREIDYKARDELNMLCMQKYLSDLRISDSDLSRLNVIHVSGSKGKGSTCAYCESILRHHGYKTGFYSSPHLMEHRERIRIQGRILEKETFAKYFWEVYTTLKENEKPELEGRVGGSMTYFRLLTVLALHVFLKENVDVVIWETGLGGEYDCTNIVRNPVVCGVTSLALDHVNRLGTSIEQIAWHKAGIFKPGIPAFTVEQPLNAMRVLEERARNIRAPLYKCADLGRYQQQFKLGIEGSKQPLNASLAIQLCSTWIGRHEGKCNSGRRASLVATQTDYTAVQLAEPATINANFVKGLEECEWLGRNQIIAVDGVTFYLDGAPTHDSIQQCAEWFQTKTSLEDKEGNVFRILLFYCTSDRDANGFLQLLVNCGFNAAVFCTNAIFKEPKCADQVKKQTAFADSAKRQETFETLLGNNAKYETSQRDHGEISFKSCAVITIQEAVDWIIKLRDDVKKMSKPHSGMAKNDPAVKAPVEEMCVREDATEIGIIDAGNDQATDNNRNRQKQVHVLVTGSLQIVAGVMWVLKDRQSDR